MEKEYDLIKVQVKTHGVIGEHIYTKKLALPEEHGYEFFNTGGNVNAYHLYAISDDEINNKDICYDMINDKIFRVCEANLEHIYSWKENYKKVVLTTDKSIQLPLIDKRIVIQYIEKCNLLNVGIKTKIKYGISGIGKIELSPAIYTEEEVLLYLHNLLAAIKFNDNYSLLFVNKWFEENKKKI